MRLEGLGAAEAKHLARTARGCGGDFRRLEPAGAGRPLLVLLPADCRNSFLHRLRGEESLRPLARELERAARAARGAHPPLRLPGRSIPLVGRTIIQGILNVTPDSFYDGGSWATPRRAVDRALRMIEEGADLVDIGGESTRPGSQPVSAREEIRRVLPVIERLAGRISAPISVDTTKAEVAEAALGAGAEIVNDISGLTFDPKLAEVAARHRAAVIVSHTRGLPRTMQKQPRYRHLLPEVTALLQASVRRAVEAGVRRDAILADPGIGFGKTARHNLLLLRLLPVLHSTGCPLLVGASRKSFLGRILGDGGEKRFHGSLAVAALAIAGGASVLRVHDVAATVAVARVVEAVREAPGMRP